MATQAMIVSFAVQDADGDRSSVPIYGTFDDGVATLSSLAAWCAARASDLDGILDGQIVGLSKTLFQALPGGLKPTPNTGSDVERGAIFTYALSGLAASHSHGIEVPAFLPTIYSGDAINFGNAALIAWIAGLTPPYGTVTPTNEDWTSNIASVRRGRKTFRKHR